MEGCLILLFLPYGCGNWWETIAGDYKGSHELTKSACNFAKFIDLSSKRSFTDKDAAGTRVVIGPFNPSKVPKTLLDLDYADPNEN
jgi:hypothetical protein